MSAASDYRASLARFNRAAVPVRRALTESTIQRRTADGVDIGTPLCVSLTSVREERELAADANGFVKVKKAILRVAKTSPWKPVTGEEFYRESTGELFRLNGCTGADLISAPEITCEVVVISG